MTAVAWLLVFQYQHSSLTSRIMSDLTKEHFEEVVSGLAIRKELEGLPTKSDLETQSGNLRAYVDGAFEAPQWVVRLYGSDLNVSPRL
ncbi:MAG: hypothetical protein M3Y07_08400 [Acidobacteriota bacterium]|nr:hypothetical protein [Acidobacteriota bacterium]